MQIAVIDLGTNTFNLLLARLNADCSFTTVYSGKLPAIIGKGGINQHIITTEAINRAIDVLNRFKQIIANNGGADKIVAIATSAVRDAKNNIEFINAVENATNIEVRIISGDDEAYFIYEGVRQTINIRNETVLTLDIGGGSNEFIIANGDTIFWKHSFPLGVARILELFNPEDPIKSVTVDKIENYFESGLTLLWNESAKYQFKTLIGSSGSFDTYRAILCNGVSDASLSYNITIDKYFALHKLLTTLNKDQRLKLKGMEPLRVDMIVLASIFTNFIVKQFGIQQIIQSDYSLKEGVMSLLAKGKF